MSKFKIKSEATDVASPRSRKAGQKAMDKTTQELHTLVENLEKLMGENVQLEVCLLYTSPSPRDRQKSRMPSSA